MNPTPNTSISHEGKNYKLGFSTEKNQHNFNVMRTENRFTYCVNAEGYLERITGLKALRYKISSSYRSKVNEETNKAVTVFIKEIKPKKLSSEQGKINRSIKRAVFEKIFFEDLKPLKPEIFDRSEISSKTLHLLGSKNHYKPREHSKLYSYQPQDVTYVKDEKFQTLVNRARLAQKLGVESKQAHGGANGAIFIRDLSGKTLGVFKSNEALPHPKWFQVSKKIRRLLETKFNCFRTVAFFTPEENCKAEVAASLVNDTLKAKITPKTREVMFEINGKETTGSFQLFINEESRPAHSALKISRFCALNIPKLALWRHFIHCPEDCSIKTLSKVEVDRLAIYNFLTGDLDCHSDNYFIGVSGKIYKIDNGRAFPQKHADTHISQRNQYHWKFLPQAKVLFGEEAKEFVTDIRDKRASIMTLLGEENQLLNSQQQQVLNDRIDVLIDIVLNSPNSTPFSLSKMRSTKDFSNYKFQGKVTPETPRVKAKDKVKDPGKIFRGHFKRAETRQNIQKKPPDLNSESCTSPDPEIKKRQEQLASFLRSTSRPSGVKESDTGTEG